MKAYEMIMTIDQFQQNFDQAAFHTLKIISIYKSLNEKNEDSYLGMMLLNLAAIQMHQEKWGDCHNSFNECEKIFKKLPPTDPEARQLIQQHKELKEQYLKVKADYDKKNTKPLMQRVLPDTPLKMAIWAGVFASVAGIAAYAIMKKR